MTRLMKAKRDLHNLPTLLNILKSVKLNTAEIYLTQLKENNDDRDDNGYKSD